MQYTTEEAAMLCGLLLSYFNNNGVSNEVREQYTRLCSRIGDDTLESGDFTSIVKALEFISSTHEFIPSDRKMIQQLLAKTISLAKT